MGYFQSIEFWSAFMYWFIGINVVVTFLFTIVVIIGGIFDLKFLLKALRTSEVDNQDDGTVRSQPASPESK